MSSLWHWKWSVVLYMHFHIFFWKYVNLETFHEKLQYWSSRFFIGLEISWIEPPPLHPSSSSHFFMLIFIISSRLYYLYKFFCCGFTFILQKTQAIRHSSSSNKINPISNQIKLHYIIFWIFSFLLPHVEIR